MIALVNPNTSAATTDAMVRVAQTAAGLDQRIAGITAPFGAPLITEPGALAEAEDAVASLAPQLARAHAVIIAAFGDPGLLALSVRLNVPVTGIAEASMLEAYAGGRRFAVVTTTPDLRARISETAARYGCDGFLGTWTTTGDPVAVTNSPDLLRSALARSCARAADAGAEAIVIGGGPLAEAARDLAGHVPVPLIEPVPAAVRLSLARCNDGAML